MWWLSLALAGPMIEQVQAPSLRWEALRSEHFVVHYSVERGGQSDHAAAERILAEAEAIWVPMCAEAEYFPVQRTHVLLLPDDGVNGWTWPSWDWIVISDHPGGVLERMRGPMDPIRLILRHEFGHLLSLKKSKRIAEPVEGVDIGIALRDGERDVTVDAALEISALSPHWWSEGAAESLFLAAGLGEVGAEREATLRTAVAEGRVLGDAWSTRFVKDDWGDSERSYQQGRAFVAWLGDVYGLTVADIAEAAGTYGGVNAGLAALTGQKARFLVQDFRMALRLTVEDAAPPFRGKLAPTGRWAMWPVPAEGRLAHHSGGYLLVEGREPETVEGLGLEAGWYPRLAVPVAYGSRSAMVGDLAVVVGSDKLRGPLDFDVREVHALHRIDLAGEWGAGDGEARKRATRIAGTAHALDPALSVDGRELAFVQAVDGGGRLLRGPVDGPFTVVAEGPGEWWRTPVFLPDGRLLAIHRLGDQAEIAEIVDGRLVYWTASAADEADLTVAPDGRVVFTADVDGVRDVFALSPSTGRIEQLTAREGGAHTPAMTAAGDLILADMTAHGLELVGIPAGELGHAEVTAAFHDQRPPEEALPVPAHARARGHGWTAVAMTPFVQLGMSAADDLDLSAGLSVGARSYIDASEVNAAIWLGEEAGASASVRQRLGPVQLHLSGVHQRWQRPQAGTLVEGSYSEATGDLSLVRGVTWASAGGRLARLGIRDEGAIAPRAAVFAVGAHDARRVDLAVEGYEFEMGAELGDERGPYALGWVHLDVEARAPRELSGAWRHHHAVLMGLDLIGASPDVHPWLRPRAGGLGATSILGRTAAFPGYPELSWSDDVVAVGRLGYRFPLFRIRRLAGPWFVEGATFEVDGHAGVVGDALPLDAGGRLVIRGTVRDARWDLGLRVAVPTMDVSVGDIDGDDVFDVLSAPPGSREQPARPRVYLELGRVR